MKNNSIISIMSLLVLFSVSSCGPKKADVSDNPFFTEYDTPFGVPPFDKIKFEHYKPAFEEGMKQQKLEIDSIVNNAETATFENTIAKLDASGELLSKVGAVFYNMMGTDTDDSLQKLAQEIAPALSQHEDDIMLNNKLFDRVKVVYENRSKLNHEQMRLTEITYKDFVRNGALLGEKEKAALRDVNKELSVLTLKFGENVLAENNAFKMYIDKKEDLAGLLQSSIDMAAAAAEKDGQKGKWLFTADKPSLIPFLQYSERRDLREKMYRGYFMRGNNDNANDNKKIVEKIVKFRDQKAKLLGFENHAAFVLDRNMSKNAKNVYELLDKIWDAALPVAKAEAAEMQKMIDAEGGNFKLASWDWWFYAEKIRKAKYDLDEEMIRPYLSIDNVREGIFLLCNKLYGISFKKIDNVPVYNENVIAYEVLDTNKSHLAVLYMDFYPRSSKSGGAWCTSFRDQYRKNGKNISPVVSLVMNFTPGNNGEPALLNLDEAETFFHEFGHAVHCFFGDVTYKKLSGYVPRDFVELPSQVMEHWTFHPEFLKQYAKHYKTGKPISDSLVEKIKKTSNFNQGFATVEFIAAALLDMDYHTTDASNGIDVLKFEKESMNKIGLIDEILPRYRSTYFGHIFDGGYSAGYYSYVWSEVLDSDIFEAFEESGNIFNKNLAHDFRTKILAPGGLEDAMDMFVAFRGREPKVEALLRNRGFLK